MEANRLLEGAAYGPEALKVIYQAFDEAWSDIGGNFSDPAQISAAQVKLAKAILAAANGGSRNVAALKRAGVEEMRELTW
jgi:hypothetical protein